MRRPGLGAEAAVAGFGFLLEFVWEFLQIPFYAGMSSLSHAEGVASCAGAALGDVAILLVAYWSAAVVEGDRRWIGSPSTRAWMVFMAVGVVVTVALEVLATRVLGRWQYSQAMPVLQPLGVGLLPVVQWLALPPAVVWLARRHLVGARVLRAADAIGGR